MKRSLRNIGLLLLVVCCWLNSAYSQDTVNVPSQTPKKPIPWFFIDGKPIEGSFVSKVKADEIAMLQVLPLNKAIELHGNKGKNGVTYIFTKSYCIANYQKAFSSRSEEYKKVLKNEGGSDARIQYILDGKVLKENFEGRLFSLRNDPSYYLKIIESEGLELYGVSDKVYGFVITKRVN